MFLNEVMLAGLGGAAVPLVLHLLSRWRYRTVEWGAMMFLDGMAAQQTHSARVRQWVLLGMRMLLVGLLAVAMARPIIRSRAAAGEGRITAVIVLDRSQSMSCEEAGRSRFDKAREAVLQILAGLRKGDEVALVLLGDGVEIVHREPTGNLQTVARYVSDLTVSSGLADMASGLEAARAILDQPGRINRELYVVCDRQAVNWQLVESSWAANWQKWIENPRSPVRFFVLPVGGEQLDNVAIERVELVDGLAVRGQTCDAEVRVRNYGQAPAAAMDLTLYRSGPGDPPRKRDDHGRRIKTVSVTVAGKSTTTVRVPVTFDQIGSHVLTAEVKSPGLQADNRFNAAMDVIDPINVLIVSGDERVAEVRRESFFLKLAMAPYQTAQKRGRDPAIVSVCGIEEWGKIDLDRHRVFVLANVREIALDQARALEQKVYEGAGLIICPGNLSRVDNYNSMLYRDGLGLMPAKLEPPVPADGSRATSLLGLEPEHAIFRFRRGGDPLPGAVVGRFFPATPRQADAKVLATYASGEPFLIEGPRGRGRVLLVTTPLDADWNTLPLQPFYLPFVQSMVRYVCGSSMPSRNLSVGEPLVATFAEPMDASVRLVRDDEPPIPLPLAGTQNQVTYTETQHPGIYRLEARPQAGGPRRVMHYVVQSPMDESDLTCVPAEQWERLQDDLAFVEMGSKGEPIATVLSRQREGRELWLILVVAVMCLGVGELWLARRWSREVG